MRANDQGAFWTSEVATMLGVQPITVRTWCLKLEALGMTFPRDRNDKRAFTQEHVGMFRFLQSLTQEKKLKLDEAIAATVERFAICRRSDEKVITGLEISVQENAVEARYDALFASHQALLEELQETKKTQQEILLKLDQQAERQAERDQARMATMRELMEQRQSEAEQKKSIFGRIFGK